MSDVYEGYKAASTPNAWKEVKVTIGNKDIWALFGGDQRDTYFAHSIRLFLDGDKGVNFKVSAKYVPVLEQMMKKFKDSTVGKAIGLIQKMADLAGGIDAGSLATTAKSGSASKIFSNLQVVPANVRYQTKFQNLPAWDSTGPVELGSFTFKFYLGMAGEYNGRKEVYNPALAFMKVNQPSEIRSGMLQGPLPNTAWVYGVIGASLAGAVKNTITKYGTEAAVATAKALPTYEGKIPLQSDYQRAGPLYYPYSGSAGQPTWVPDESAYAAAMEKYNKDKKSWEGTQNAESIPARNYGESAVSQIESGLNNAMSAFEKNLAYQIQNWPGTGLIQITIGQFTLPRMTVENTSVEFSYDTDENGFPIWAEVTWSGCKTLEIATVQQMPLLLDDHRGIDQPGDFDTYGAVIKGTIPEDPTLATKVDVVASASSPYSKESESINRLG
jgi:hypothetical protein